MTIKETILPLADAYDDAGTDHYENACEETFVKMNEARAALCAALDAADREVDLTKDLALVDYLRLTEKVEALKAENLALRLDAERYRAVRKATINEDDAFLDELDNHEAPKTEAEFDAIFDAARAALGEKT